MRLCVKRKAGIWSLVAIVVYVQFDTLLPLLIECLHAAFEMVEFILDRLVEHIFHTDLHTTQVITFYLMLLIAGVVLYKLVRLLPDWYRTRKNNLTAYYHQLSREIHEYWRTSSAINKMKWWAVLSVGTGMAVLGLFS
jgi:sorbitol-specific phosphotransferase system component IIC